jgi:hypothetical protein
MNFILVNGRTPCRKTFCLQCCNTQLPYCNYECYTRQRNLAARERTRVESSLVKGAAGNSKGS